MNPMKKRLLSLLLSGSLMASLLPLGASAKTVSYNQVDSLADMAQVLRLEDQDYFDSVQVDLTDGSAVKDGEETTFAQEFGLDDSQAEELLDSSEALENYLQEEGYTVDLQGDSAQVTNPYQTRRIIVKADQLARDYGAKEITRYPSGDAYVLQFATEEDTAAACEEIAQDYAPSQFYVDEIISAQNTLSPVNETAWETSWGVSYMGLDKLMLDMDTYGVEGDVTVAVIDTGAELDHPFLKDRLSPLRFDFSDGDTDVSEKNVDIHGTHVCGIVAQCTPDDVQIIMLKVFDSEGYGALSWLELALQSALEIGADVVNMSVGVNRPGANSEYFLDSILAQAYYQGVVVCCSAGNNNGDTSDVGGPVTSSYPACSPYTWAISAVGQDGTLADYSNYGPEVDFTAPGTDIPSAYSGQQWECMSGTSMASPHVAGAAALIHIIHPEYNSIQIYDVLKRYARDYGAAGKDNLYGWGCVNLANYWQDELESDHTAWVNPFIDVSEDAWYYKNVAYVHQAGLFSGMTNITFEPEISMSRAMLMSVLYRLSGRPDVTGSNPFIDVPEGEWYTTAVKWAYQNGVAYGVTDTRFDPNAPLTREQLVAFFYRYAKLQGKGVDAYDSLGGFTDRGAVSSYARSAFQWAVGAKIIYGMTDTLLGPQGSGTRAQVAAILQRFIEYYETYTPNPDAPVNPDLGGGLDSIQVGDQLYTVGMTAAELTALAGQPDETLDGVIDFTWYIYGTDTYEDFLMAGVRNGVVIRLCASGPNMRYDGYQMGDAVGMLDTNDAPCQVRVMVDDYDDYALHCVLLTKTGEFLDYSRYSAANLAAESQINFHLVNAFRVSHGLDTLTWSDTAATAARLHSEDMAGQDYFSHDSLDGRSSSVRMEAQGIQWMVCGENIAAGYSDGIDVYAAWVNSAGHRGNMLEASYTHLGVGCGYNSGSTYRIYFTQDFYCPR